MDTVRIKSLQQVLDLCELALGEAFAIAHSAWHVG